MLAAWNSQILKDRSGPLLPGAKGGDTGHSECLMGTEFELRRWNESLGRRRGDVAQQCECASCCRIEPTEMVKMANVLCILTAVKTKSDG